MKRSATGKKTPNVNGLPEVDDMSLVRLVLGMPIAAALREQLTEIALTLEPGKFGQLKRAVRAKLVRIASASGAMPKLEPAHKKVANFLNGDGRYEIRRTAGTAFAEQVLANRPLAPPSRRSA